MVVGGGYTGVELACTVAQARNKCARPPPLGGARHPLLSPFGHTPFCASFLSRWAGFRPEGEGEPGDS